MVDMMRRLVLWGEYVNIASVEEQDLGGMKMK